MFDSSKLMYSSGADFYEHPIEQSLRFNDDDSAYLSRTPSSAGNRKTWTYSAWVKRGVLGQNKNLMSAGTGGNDEYTLFHFNTSDQLVFSQDEGAGGVFWFTATPRYRDPSAWYHIVLSVDTTQATSSDRIKLYVNGEQVTSFDSISYPTQNRDTYFNAVKLHRIGARVRTLDFLYDGYMAEMHLIDGAAYDASYFGETKSGVWIPKEYTGGYGTNGFYLPFNHDYSVEGFSAVTFETNGAANYIGGVGFQPDLIWIKPRDVAYDDTIYDSVRGRAVGIAGDKGETEFPASSEGYDLVSFENDGFLLGPLEQSWAVNKTGHNNVAWCWDAGSGSPVSNTDGSITSTVKASTDYGFSVVTYTGVGSNASTVGHGLSSAPEMMLVKTRDQNNDWVVYHKDVGNNGYLYLNTSGGTQTTYDVWGDTTPTADVFTVGYTNGNFGHTEYPGWTYVAYCWHSVSGYSKIGSYTGNGSTSGPSVTTGFKPAWVMVKQTDTSDNNWFIFDSTRDPNNPLDNRLKADTNNTEASDIDAFNFTDTGFELISDNAGWNASGGNYIYMAFADKREAAFWLDQSGNNNDFENNNLTESDISLDSPTNNFATWNTVQDDGGLTLSWSEGNLKFNAPSSGWGTTTATIAYPSTGKYYWEAYLIDSGELIVGMQDVSTRIGTSWTSIEYGYYTSGLKFTSGTQSAYGASYTTGDIIGVAYDADTGTLTMYKNNVSQGALVTGASGEFVPTLITSSTYPVYSVSNFGQDSSFAGNKTAQGNTDDNGYGDFYYAPPTGYLALCTANLEVPDAMNPALDASPQDYFNTVLYTGDSTSNRGITGVGFQPDWLWIKNRSNSYDHMLYDAIRGAGNYLESNTTDAEASGSHMNSFDTDGFTVSFASSNRTNVTGETYVAWNWKANGSGVSNTDGSITSTVSANTDAGFSIVSYTDTGSFSDTGHGLNQTPELWIGKRRDSTSNWVVGYTVVDGTYDVMILNLTNASSDYSSTGSPTSTTVPTLGFPNTSSVIQYCFHSVEGFSKFGSYTGNGSTDGPFVYTGFRPAFVMVKRTDTGGSGYNWDIFDNTRSPVNITDEVLWANLSNSEGNWSGSEGFDFLSNGFKLRINDLSENASGGTYIYMAFAETPFKYSVGR